MSDTSSSDPGRIERELDSTRSRLGDHLSELQDRLSPGQVLDDLMAYFRGNEGGEFARNLVDSVRANPLPAAVTGIGLAWLMASNPRAGNQTQASPTTGHALGNRSVHGRPPSFDQGGYDAMIGRVRTAEQGVSPRDANEPEHAYAARLDEARGQAIGLARHAQETTESFGQRVRDALASAEHAVMRGVHDLRDQVGSTAGSLGGAAQGAARSVGNAAQGAMHGAGGLLMQGSQAGVQTGGHLATAITESPVLLGALGLAAGALLGALLPQSEGETAALGGIAGQARDTARGLAQGALDRGSRVATTVMETGRDSAQAHGLASERSPRNLVDAATSGELAGSAKEVLQDVLQAGDKAVRREVLGEGGKPASEQPGQ